MKSNSADLTDSDENGRTLIAKPILRNRLANTSNNYNYLSEDTNTMRMNFLKVDMYPDPYRHITTTILEYPETKTKLIETKIVDDKETRLKNEKAKRMSRRNNLRYMTQPVTLIEIKEIEEDAVVAFTTQTNTLNNQLINDADNNKPCQSNERNQTSNEIK